MRKKRRKGFLGTAVAFPNSLKSEKVDFIKMDIEGAEEVAILGAGRTIERFHPKWSITSYHHPGNEPQHPKLVKLLRDFEYRIEEKGSTHIFAYSDPRTSILGHRIRKRKEGVLSGSHEEEYRLNT